MKKRYFYILSLLLIILLLQSCSSNYLKEKRHYIKINRYKKNVSQEYGKNSFSLSKLDIKEEDIKWTLRVKFKDYISSDIINDIIENNNCTIFSKKEDNFYYILTPGEKNYKNVSFYYQLFKDLNQVALNKSTKGKEVYYSELLDFSFEYYTPIGEEGLSVIFRENLTSDQKKEFLLKYKMKILLFEDYKKTLSESNYLYVNFPAEDFLEIYTQLIKDGRVKRVEFCYAIIVMAK
ncbi:hypothetical protein KAU33_11670 [Candidatus Dependentiae bacterium]|nr:hypothetical protein [Candidatus Dependentiae bacterium]